MFFYMFKHIPGMNLLAPVTGSAPRLKHWLHVCLQEAGSATNLLFLPEFATQVLAFVKVTLQEPVPRIASDAFHENWE
jgi:hypothetical protein